MKEHDTDIVERVVDTLESLHLLTAASRLYGEEHPRTGEAAEQLATRLDPVLRYIGDLHLEVVRDGLYWQGHEVYKDSDDREGIARTAYREGIVSLIFAPGVARAEILIFARILGTNLNLPKWEEETLASLLWQAKLEHILYEAVEHLSDAQELSETAALGEEGYANEIIRQILEPTPPEPGQGAGGMGAVPRPTEGDGGEARRIKDFDGSEIEESETTAEAAEARGHLGVPDPSWTNAHYLASLDLNQWMDEPEGELEQDVDVVALRREVEADNEASVLRRMVEILVVGGARGRPELDPREAMSLVQRSLRREEADGDALWKPVVRLVSTLVESDSPLIQAGSVELDGWLDACTAPAVFPEFAAVLRSDDREDHALLHHFLAARNGQRARLLVQRMSGMRSDRRLSWVMDEVAGIVGHEIGASVGDLHRRPVEEVMPMIDVLRRVGDQGSNERLYTLLHHRAPDVRAAAVRALPQALPQQPLLRVLELLTDRDTSVRRAAVELLASRRPAGAFQALQVLVGGRRFEAASPAVKMSMALGMGVVGGDAALTVFEQIIGRHGRVGTGAAAKADFEACAAAMARVGTVRARQALVQGSKSWNLALRRACRDALDGKLRRV